MKTGFAQKRCLEPWACAESTGFAQDVGFQTPFLCKAVNQLLPTLSIEDAIGEEVVALKNLLLSWGLQSEIFAERYEAYCARVRRWI